MKDKILSLRRFTKRNSSGVSRIPGYNNFFMYFVDTPTNQDRRQEPHFLKFKEEHSDLERRLTKEITYIINREIDRERALMPAELDLYDAYLKMRTYLRPNESDEVLFS